MSRRKKVKINDLASVDVLIGQVKERCTLEDKYYAKHEWMKEILIQEL